MKMVFGMEFTKLFIELTLTSIWNEETGETGHI